MHPLGLYLAITNNQHKHGWQQVHGWVADDERRASVARVDATPIAELEPQSRIGRLAAIVRRRVMRTAGA